MDPKPSVPTGPPATEGPVRKPTERLHKFLASTGAGSRRECETFIEQGRVTVDGQVVTRMGVKVDPRVDDVRLDGERVKPQERVYYLLNKPTNYICTNSDERGRPRAIDLVGDRTHRIYTVGRLDADSRGLILLTNDGEIANIVCHPRYRIEKSYRVAVRGEVTRQQIANVEAGVWLAEGKSSPAIVRPIGRNPKRNETILEMTLFEGRNREIRRVFASVGLNVRRLERHRIGPLELGDLAPGAFVKLDAQALAFVHEAEKLYLANKAEWDAALPPETARRPRPRGPQQRGGPRTRRRDEGSKPRRGAGGHGGSPSGLGARTDRRSFGGGRQGGEGRGGSQRGASHRGPQRGGRAQGGSPPRGGDRRGRFSR